MTRLAHKRDQRDQLAQRRAERGRENADDALRILSGIRGRRENADRLEENHVRAYEPKPSENTDLRARRATIPNEEVRAAIKRYLDLVERAPQPGQDTAAEQAERLHELERLEEVLGAYIRVDPLPHD